MSNRQQDDQEIEQPAPRQNVPPTPVRGRGVGWIRGRGRGRAAWMMRRQNAEIISGWKHTVSALTGQFGPYGQVQSYRNPE